MSGKKMADGEGVLTRKCDRSVPTPTKPNWTAPTGAEWELLSSLRHVLIGGRWALFLAELSVVALRFRRIEASFPAEEALAGLVVYNILALLALRGLPPRRVPAAFFLAADIVTVGVLTTFTGRITSPFAGLYFLVILEGAVYHNLAGGVMAAAVASAVILGSSSLAPPIWADVLRGEAGTQMIPHLFLTGGFGGYLVSRLKQLHDRRIEFEERLRHAQYEAGLRQREAMVAREVQRAALVDPPCHPQFEITVRFEPAREVGGDFYSFVSGGAEMGVLIGDVSGKGIAAALTSTSICHLIQYLQPLENPGRFLATLNRGLSGQVPGDVFATMTFARLDPKAERIQIYNAGHPPALIVSGERMQHGQRPNLPLGMFPEAKLVPEAFPFRRGDTLVLYSDGFIEARNPAGELLSVDGFAEMVRRLALLPPEQMASRLVEDTRAFGTVSDDLTLVVARFRPA
jgi:serine phosphatase RsbU (regulator of sigma subunit)